MVRKTLPVFVVLALCFVFLPSAHADIIGAIGCGSSSSTVDPTCSGTINVNVSSGQYSTAGVDVSLTAISGATSPPLDQFQIAWTRRILPSGFSPSTQL
jgi:hypothetical protein